MNRAALQTRALPLALQDKYGRTVKDLRISLTDRCNLRCTYCMPADGMEWIPSPEILSDDEIVRLASIGVTQLGINHIRLTGGEPLVRPSLVSLVSQMACLQTPDGKTVEVSITTNGIGLAKKAAALKEAGLTRVNVSLDALNPDLYSVITRRNRIQLVLDGLEAAREVGLQPIKINTVALRKINETEFLPLLDFCLEKGYQLRFIEHMPLGPKHTWERVEMVQGDEILAALSERYQLVSLGGTTREASPAEHWGVYAKDASIFNAATMLGTVGVIASVSKPFCGTCDRARLTADGQLRTCLFSQTETDFKELLRGGASDSEIAQLWAKATYLKPKSHGIDEEGFEQPERNMSAIGG